MIVNGRLHNFLALALTLAAVCGPAAVALGDIRVINNSDFRIEACIRYTRGQYASNSGFGGGGSATMSVTYPDSVVEGWFVIPPGSPGSIPTPGNGDVSVYLRVAGRDIIPDTANNNGSTYLMHPTIRFTTVNNRIDGVMSVATPNEAAQHGYVHKTFYRVDPSRPISVFGTYQPTLPSPPPALNFAPPPGGPPGFGPGPFKPASPPPPTFGPAPAALAGRTFRAFASGSAEGLTFKNRFCGWYRFEPNGRLVQTLPAGAGTLVLGDFAQKGNILRVAMTDGSSATGSVFPNGFSLNLNDNGTPFLIHGEP